MGTIESLPDLGRQLTTAAGRWERARRDAANDALSNGQTRLRSLASRTGPSPQTPREGPPQPAAARPAPVPERAVVVGRSRRGKPILAYGRGEGRDVTLILGAIHGDERNTAGVVERLRQYLEQVPEVLRGRRVVLVPVVNPDAWETRTRVNAAGVDINRNFPSGWQPFSLRPRYYPGPGPVSEPETRALMNLMEVEDPRKVVAIHAPLHCLNWDGSQGRELAEVMHRYNRYRLRPNIGYTTPGSFGGHFGRRKKIGIVTLELPSIATERAWRDNRAALVAAIRHEIT